MACFSKFGAIVIMSEHTKNHGRILIADDDQAIRQLLLTIMQREHLDADAVSDGVEAIEKLEENDYSVILLDLMMPRLDGFGVVDYLRENPPAVKPVVLVITAYADQKFKQVDPAIVSGALRKPFEVADLGSLVRLCARGDDADLSRKLFLSHDRTIRELAAKHVPRGVENN